MQHGETGSKKKPGFHNADMSMKSVRLQLFTSALALCLLGKHRGAVTKGLGAPWRNAIGGEMNAGEN